MSVSPASYSGRILSTPSASCFAPRPLGTSLASLYGLLTNPIGREVNMWKNASSFSPGERCCPEGLAIIRITAVFAEHAKAPAISQEAVYANHVDTKPAAHSCCQFATRHGCG